MRIALIASDSGPVPAVRGGSIPILIDGIKDALAQRNELTVYTVADPALRKEEIKESIRYLRFPRQIFGAGVAADLKHRPEEFDLIHVFNRPKYIPHIKAASPLSRIVLSLHNEMLGPKKISKRDGLAIIRFSDKILTISAYLARTLIQRFEPAAPKVTVWYSGVDTTGLPPAWSPEGKRMRAELRGRYGLDHKKVLLFAGRILRKKGVHVLLEAFLILAREMSDLALVILGGNWTGDLGENAYLRYLHSLCEPVADRVVFTGFVAPQEIHRYYLSADLFICPSQWQEPLGRVHYEAMAAGLPIVTMARGGITEIIRDGSNGVVVQDYRNPEALARAVRMLLERPDQASAMAKRARRDVEAKFSFHRVAGELLHHYEEVFEPPTS